MSFAANNFYAHWRRQCGVIPALHEGGSFPPERLVQAIWQHQRLRRERLRTLDGRPVQILHPGFLSFEGGPDFRDAVVQFVDEPPVNGPIEVDLHSSGWHSHGHDRNPAFRSVILHVVWFAPKYKPDGPPILALSDTLDAPLVELAEWLGGETAPALPEQFRGRCSAPLREFEADELQELLQQAALVRMRGKADQLAARAREAGWEQSLWEGLFRALGYKHNTWPMQRLAELRSRWKDGVTDPGALQSRLLGIANLLPPDLTRSRRDADDFLRKLWDRWWRERDAFEDCQLPRDLWRLHGIRPSNHPQRRLALAAHWLVDGNLVGELERWGVNDVAAPQPSAAKPKTSKARCSAKTPLQIITALTRILQPAHDEFWTRHLTLRSARSAKRQLLLGEARVTDLAVNVILPWLWARAVEGRDEGLQTAIEVCYRTWPAAEDNSVLKLARQRLLGGAGVKSFRTAASQQGLLQILRDFCEHSNAVCDQCRFPELAQAWKVETGYSR